MHRRRRRHPLIPAKSSTKLVTGALWANHMLTRRAQPSIIDFLIELLLETDGYATLKWIQSPNVHRHRTAVKEDRWHPVTAYPINVLKRNVTGWTTWDRFNSNLDGFDRAGWGPVLSPFVTFPYFCFSLIKYLRLTNQREPIEEKERRWERESALCGIWSISRISLGSLVGFLRFTLVCFWYCSIYSLRIVSCSPWFPVPVRDLRWNLVLFGLIDWFGRARNGER